MVVLSLTPSQTPCSPSLGVRPLRIKEGANFCHDEGDRASDDKKQKVIARNRSLMVCEINSHFPDTEQQVTCWTC